MIQKRGHSRLVSFSVPTKHLHSHQSRIIKQLKTNHKYFSLNKEDSLKQQATTHTTQTKMSDKNFSIKRSGTDSSMESETKTMRSSSSARSLSPTRKSTSESKPEKQRPQRQTFTECGRHSNKWLFNNVSISQAVKTLFEK